MIPDIDIGGLGKLPDNIRHLTTTGSALAYIAARQDDKIRRGIERAIADAAALPVSEFADEYVMLERGGEPGRYRTARTPYLRDIQDDFGNLSLPLVVHIKPAQVGATQALVNATARVIHCAPTSILFITETGDKARDLVKDRFDPLFLRSPFHFPDTRGRDNRDVLMSRQFAGGAIRFFGAQSATSFSSIPAQLTILDEYARMKFINNEGSPLALAFGRGRTFGEGAAIRVNSTPLIKDDGEGSLYTSYMLGDCREWFWRCHRCDGEQFYTIDYFRYDKKGRAWFECQHCGGEIDEGQRGRILREGQWKATKEAEMTGARSYHTTGFMSPVGWTSWRQIAERHKLAIAGRIDYQAFANLELGIFYEPALTMLEHTEVLANRGGHRRKDEVLPDGAMIITAAADCQEEFIKFAYYAWGREMKAWLLDYDIISNPITSDAGQRELTAAFARTWKTRTGAVLPITLAGIDSGGAAGTTERVYSYAGKFPQPKITPKGIRYYPHPASPYVIATKGGRQLQPDKLFIRASQIRKDKAKVGQRLFIMGTPLAKAELYRWLRRPKQQDGKPEERMWGGISLPADIGDDYAKEMIAEIPRAVRSPTGQKTVRWHLPSGRANEGLDLHIINRFCAAVMGLDVEGRDGFWRQLEAAAAGKPAADIDEVKTKRQRRRPIGRTRFSRQGNDNP